MFKLIKTSLLIASIILLSSCNPKVSSYLVKEIPPLDYDEEVIVLGINDPMPIEGDVIGTVKIGDTGFSTNCGYETVIENLKMETRRIGGNVAKITDLKAPGFSSSCYKIEAKAIKIQDTESIAREEIPVDPNIDYAKLYVFRYGGAGALVGYDLFLDNIKLCRVINNFKTEIRISDLGEHSIWAKTEAKREVKVHFEAGKSYYLRCGLTMGIMVGQPSLELVSYEGGKSQYEGFNAKNK